MNNLININEINKNIYIKTGSFNMNGEINSDIKFYTPFKHKCLFVIATDDMNYGTQNFCLLGIDSLKITNEGFSVTRSSNSRANVCMYIAFGY